MVQAYLVHCRPGFEKEAAAELQHLGERHDWQGYLKLHADSAFALYCGPELPENGPHAPRWQELAFARQLVFLTNSMPLKLDPQDRISTLVTHLAGQSFHDLVLDSPDTNDGKAMSGFSRPSGPPCALCWTNAASCGARRPAVCTFSSPTPRRYIRATVCRTTAPRGRKAFRASNFPRRPPAVPP